MNFVPTESQKKTLDLMKKKLNSFDLRPNYILTGKAGVGKSWLGRWVAKDIGGIYISFIQEYSDDFLKEIDYLDVDGIDFLNYLKKVVLRDIKDSVVVIDSFEFILNQIFARSKLKNFYRSFRRFIFDNKVILIVPEIYFEDELLDEDMVFKLHFTERDGTILSEHFGSKKGVCKYENIYQILQR